MVYTWADKRAVAVWARNCFYKFIVGVGVGGAQPEYIQRYVRTIFFVTDKVSKKIIQRVNNRMFLVLIRVAIVFQNSTQ